MSAEANSAYEYQVGGSLPLDAPTYVKRQADDDLYRGVRAGQFCYVLNSRQTGKSSLRVRTMQRLQADGVACGAVDLTAISSQDITPDQWYAGVAYTLASNFNLLDQVDINTWWCDRVFLSPMQRLSKFIREVLLAGISQNLAIFVDEIDSVLSLNFQVDDFFSLIHSCYNQRTEQPEYKRLTWVLLGVATPLDLIGSTHPSTPFNIGLPIELSGFQLHEVQPLTQGLVRRFNDPQSVIREVLDWTGGQPFLTQRLCKLIVQEPKVREQEKNVVGAGLEDKLIGKQTTLQQNPPSSNPKSKIVRLSAVRRSTERSRRSLSSPSKPHAEVQNPKSKIATLVESRLIENWEAQDQPEHLRTIRDRLLGSKQRTSCLLALYQQILQHEEIAATDTPEQIELRLSGLVVKQEGTLKVYNRIYQAVFNLKWVDKALTNLGLYDPKLAAWEVLNQQDVADLWGG